MNIYIFFGAFTASIVGFGFLHNRLRNSMNHICFRKRTINLKNERELKKGGTLNELHKEDSNNPPGSSLEDEDKASGPLLEEDSQDPPESPLENDDVASWPSLGQLSADSDAVKIGNSPATAFYNNYAVEDGFRIASKGDSLRPNEWYTLDFSKVSSGQTVITLDYRDNAKENTGVFLDLLKAPNKPITLKICGSAAYPSFFEKENNRYVVLRNVSPQAVNVYLVVQNYSVNKETVIKSTKFQPVLLSNLVGVSNVLVIHYFKAEQIGNNLPNFIALARTMA